MTLETDRLRALLAASGATHTDIAARAKAAADKIAVGLAATPIPEPAPAPAPTPVPVPTVPATPIPAPTPAPVVAALVTTAHGQIITGQDIYSGAAHGINVRHNGVVIDINGIRHDKGFQGIVNSVPVSDLTILGNLIKNVFAPTTGKASTPNQMNISLENVTGLKIGKNTLWGGSSNIYLYKCFGTILIQQIEGHEAKGPMPRGQGLQANACGPGILEDSSFENPVDRSFTEDICSVIGSPKWIVRKCLFKGSNSPSGWGCLAENSANVLFEDNDFVGMGNGAVAASNTASIDTILRRNRTRDSINVGQGGRAAPKSGCLAFGSINGATRTRLERNQYWNVGAPNNIHSIWSTMIVPAGMETIKADFVPRAPVRNVFPWSG